MENKKKNKVLKILGLVGLFVLVFGLSYALFRITLTGRKKTRIKTANFGLTLTDINGNEETEGIAVDLQNALPETDEEGLARDGYKFVVTNTGNIPASYELKLNSMGDLSTEYIKYALIEKDYLKKANGDYYMGGIYSNAYRYDSIDVNDVNGPLKLNSLTNNKLDSTTLLPGEKMEYELKIWLDHDAGIEASNKTYEANIVIEGSQAEVYMSGKTGDTSKYTLYKDGTLAITGDGELKEIYVNEETGDFQIYNNGGHTIDIIYKVLNDKGLEPVDENNSTTYMFYSLVLYGHQLIGEHATFNELNEDLKNDFIYIVGDAERAAEYYNTLINHKITRFVVDEGITSAEKSYLFTNVVGNYILTLPSTITDLNKLHMSLFELQYFSYGFIVPPGIKAVPKDSRLGRTIQYLDCSNVEKIENRGIDIRILKELNIPNTVSRIDELGVVISRDNVVINIDNTQEYVESHWDSNWLGTNGYNVTINYLR